MSLKFPSKEDLQLFLCSPEERESLGRPPRFGRLATRIVEGTSLSYLDGITFYGTQEYFTTYCNRRGTILASAPDLYHAQKQGSPLLDQVHDDLAEGYIATSTSLRVRLKGPSFSGQVAHYWKTKGGRPRRSLEMPLPSNLVPLKALLSTPDGLRFIQKAFWTKDDGRSVLCTLERLLQDRDCILVIRPGEWQPRNPVCLHRGVISFGDSTRGGFPTFAYTIPPWEAAR